MEKIVRWHKLAESLAELDFGESGLVRMEVAGKKLCVINGTKGLSGCIDSCPHAGGRMSDGFIDGMGNIVCPLHRYRFDVTSGRNVSGEGYHLKTFPVEARPDGLFVGIPEKTTF